MSGERKTLAAILIFSVLIVVGAVFFLSKGTTGNQQNSKIFQIDYSRGQKIGSDSAKVRLVEFSDFQCPACKEINPIVENILKENGANVQLIYRHFPLPQHSNAFSAATAAEAAGKQGKFYEYHLKLFDSQADWSSLADPKDFFIKMAGELGLDADIFVQDLNDPQSKANIDQDIQDGNVLGIDSTPTFFINGQKATLKSFVDLKTQVDTALTQP